MTDDKAPDMDPVRKWTLIALGACVVLMIFYLVADRVTPYTSQARVNALVVPIAGEVSGTVVDVMVNSNQIVKQGEPLFQIERQRYQLAVQTAEASLETARQGTRAGTADVAAAEAKVDSARAGLRSAEQDAVRLRRIKEEDAGAISDRRIEIAENSYAAAKGNLAAAQASLRKAQEALGQVGDQNTQVQQAQAALEQAQLDLSRTLVVAPEGGIVTDVRVDRGNFAQAGAPQMTFLGTYDVWVQADFTENNLGNLKSGDAVEIVFDALPGQVFQGKVRTTGFGVSVDSAPLGSLPTIENDRQWLRDAQRFSVLIDFEVDNMEDRLNMRVGAQASVIVYADSGWIMTLLGKIKMRVVSILTYAY
ncbi:MAG: HlyD family secretion protein [Woeseiaceae bacterium]